MISAHLRNDIPAYYSYLKAFFNDAINVRAYQSLQSKSFMIYQINKEFQGVLSDEFLNNLTNDYCKNLILAMQNMNLKLDPCKAKWHLKKSIKHLPLKQRRALAPYFRHPMIKNIMDFARYFTTKLF